MTPTPIVRSIPGRSALQRIERLLYPDEVADWLGVSKRFIFSETRAGHIRCCHIGSRKGRRYDPDDIRAYILFCKQNPGQSHSRRRIDDRRRAGEL